MKKLFNKELESAGSSGSADAAPRMTECGESGRSTPICHCESVRTWQSDEIASHSFAMTEQHGRSMVEMLGTLAIMGVLSIAGIWAYGVAMDRHKTSTLIQEAQKRAVIVAGQIGFNNQKPNLSEFEPYNKTSTGEFDKKVYYKDDGLYKQFGIKVSGVKKAICENILRTIGKSTLIRRLSLQETPRTPLTTCNDTNAFLIIYNNDMQGAVSDTEYATDDSSCKSVCGTFNPETHLCDESDCEIPTNTCTADTDCNTENECMVCDTTTQACKNGCERVEYLESTGTQYIDTGFKPNPATTKIDCAFCGLSGFSGAGTQMFGARTVASSNNENNTNICFGVVGSKIYIRGDWIRRTANLVADIDPEEYIHLIAHNQTVSINGTEYSSTLEKNNTYLDYNFYLFACNTAGTIQFYNKTRQYYFKIYDNNTLVCDFIPVIAPDGEPCMFDKVTKKLFCNQGTGEDFKTNLD